jgi:hypothetical protein
MFCGLPAVEWRCNLLILIIWPDWCHSIPDMTAWIMDLTAWLLFGIVALLIILAILALFAGWFPF